MLVMMVPVQQLVHRVVQQQITCLFVQPMMVYHLWGTDGSYVAGGNITAYGSINTNAQFNGSGAGLTGYSGSLQVNWGNLVSKPSNFVYSDGGTYSINITGNANYVGGLSVASGRNIIANQIVRTDGSGYIQAGYINSNSGDENNYSSPDRVWGTNGSDSYLRTYHTASLSVGYASSAGSVAWTNVSGRPTDLGSFSNGPGYIQNNSGGTYSINISGNAGYASSAGSAGYATSAGSASSATNATNASYSSTVGINYNNGSNSTYQVLWGSGNSVYGNSTLIINPSNGTLTASGSITAFSDARLKFNVKTIENALDKTLKLRGVTYEKDGANGIGVIAQEIREVLPEVVVEGTDDDKTLSVAYGNVVGLLIEAIKELKAEIDELKKGK